MAIALGVTAEDLLNMAGGYIVETDEKGGSRDRKCMEQMVTQLSAMFAGGEIDQDSKDAAYGLLHGNLRENLLDLSQVYCTGGHSCGVV